MKEIIRTISSNLAKDDNKDFAKGWSVALTFNELRWIASESSINISDKQMER